MQRPEYSYETTKYNNNLKQYTVQQTSGSKKFIIAAMLAFRLTHGPEDILHCMGGGEAKGF